jgi:hypothetical protein
MAFPAEMMPASKEIRRGHHSRETSGTDHSVSRPSDNGIQRILGTGRHVVRSASRRPRPTVGVAFQPPAISTKSMTTWSKRQSP